MESTKGEVVDAFNALSLELFHRLLVQTFDKLGRLSRTLVVIEHSVHVRHHAPHLSLDGLKISKVDVSDEVCEDGGDIAELRIGECR